MSRKKKKKFYAVPVMIAILILAVLLTAAGYLMRRTILAGLPQYDNAPDIAVPMMLIQDSGPLRAARERAEWEARQAEMIMPTPGIPPEPIPEPTAEPTPLLETDENVIVLPEETPVPPDVTPEPLPEPTPESTPQPTPELVEESYFDNTLFIGDSKTDEMRNYKRLGEAQYFCGTNFSVYNVFDKTASDDAFTGARLDWVLRRYSFNQVYILLGYNECGYPFGGLMDQFDYVVRRVHDAQPNARIIIHAIMPAAERVSWGDYALENIQRVNGGLRDLTENYDYLYFVDCNGPFCDENGYLLSYVAADGEHLLPQYCEQWAEEIRRLAIVDES